MRVGPATELYANDPQRSAAWCLSEGWSFLEDDDAPPRLRYRADSGFHEWVGTHWQPADEAQIRARVFGFLSDERVALLVRAGSLPTKPLSRVVSEVVEAIKHCVVLPSMVIPPAVLVPGAFTSRANNFRDADPLNLLALQNGVWDTAAAELHPCSPALWNFAAANYAFDPKAECPTWRSLLKNDWQLDRDARDLLAQFFGYCLAGGLTQFHYALLIVGPPRAGKGLIARILQDVIGPDNCATPTLESLGQRFGMAELVGKRVACIMDARLSGRTDQAQLAENILNLTGEDRQRVESKYAHAQTAQRLRCKLVVISNELPAVRDPSAALAGRFRVIRLRRSFLGKEDGSLYDKLLPELPGILNWALAGLSRLLEAGRFADTADSRKAVTELAASASPVRGFLDECCRVDASASVRRDQLYANFQLWCQRSGIAHPPTCEHFGRDLHAAIPGLESAQKRVNGQPRRVYRGIGLKQVKQAKRRPFGGV